MTHPPDQQTGSSNVGSDHNRTITTGDITGNSGPIAIGWNIVQKILHVEIPIDDKSRQSLIAQVREFWVEGVLGKSLYREAWSALGLYADPKSITYAGQLASVKGEREPQPLPAGTTIAQVFDDAHHRLLILGAPGGGKTTLLLELAQVLLDRAAQNDKQAIPVVFNLSSWAQQRQSLDKWLVQELRANYGVGKNLARQWVRQRAILPLLDGLDEVAEAHRAACVKATNDYCAEHGPEGIVVCSRIADYRAIGAKLELSEAVVVQPLTDTQISTYLDRAGEPLAGVRAVLAQDTEIQQLVRVPLMLNIVSLAYQGERPEELRGMPPAEQRHRLFERYVARMLERPRKPQQIAAPLPYTPQQTNHWLRWLAGRLHENSLTVFEMERMQPWWLGRWWQRGLYVLLSALFTGAGGLVLGPLFGLLLGVLIGLGLEGVIWLFPNGLTDANVSWLTNQGDGLLFGLGGGVLFGLLGGINTGLNIGLLASLGQHVPSVRRVWHVLGAGLLSAGLAILPWWLLGFSEMALLWWSILCAAPLGAITAALVQRGAIRPTESLRWSWRHIRVRWYLQPVFGLVFGMVFGLAAGLAGGLVAGIVSGVVFGLASGLVSALVSGFSSGELQARSRPNAGTWRSLRRALMTWLGSSLLLGLGGSLIFGLAGGLVFGAGFGLITGLVPGLLGWMIFGPITSLYFGGLAFVQHWVLRLLCALSNQAPLNYARFLDYATDRILLRRVGGSYIFVHRMLLEYFASLEDTKMQR